MKVQIVKAWKWTRENAAALTVLFAIVGGTWHLSNTLATKQDIREVREIAIDVKESALTAAEVDAFRQANTAANDAFRQANTAANNAVDSLNTAVGSLNTTVDSLTGTVDDLRGTTNALRLTMSPLVRCMITLHTSDTSIPFEATVDVEAQLPENCQVAIRASASLGQ